MSKHKDQISGSIIVTGDATIDHFEVELRPEFAYSRDRPDVHIWQTSRRLRLLTRPGDALLTTRFVEGLSTDADDSSYEGAVQAHFLLGLFPETDSPNNEGSSVYRVEKYRGFSTSRGDAISARALDESPSEVGVVLIDDAGNGFRDKPDAWPAALNSKRSPIVVYKMGRPLCDGPLWQHVSMQHGKQTLVIVNAEDLRREGIQISRRLSWERTALDLVREFESHPDLDALTQCKHAIVRFGAEAAVWFARGRSGWEARLFFDPLVGEGALDTIHPGRMRGVGSAFAAGVAIHLAREGWQGVPGSVRQGLAAARRLMRHGYGRDPDRIEYPDSETLFGPGGPEDPAFVDVPVPNPSAEGREYPEHWCIVDELSPDEVEQIACKYVVGGHDDRLDRFPVGIFGKLRVIDRAEIEAYRGIQNLIKEYLAAGTRVAPISIAVFGAPGSGKSYGVTQVAESVASSQLDRLEFNLSQFQSVDELSAAFHRVRDVSLSGKCPFVFFDEFDADHHAPLGWLRYFLQPMQASQFRDRDGLHPIGRAIFVFAGGIYRTFEEFSRDDVAGDSKDGDLQTFRAAKGPDFVSRLQGYIDLMGIDRGTGGHLYMIRRAFVLRSLLFQKAPHLFHHGKCQIDPGVLRALIKVPSFKHGVRSLSTLIDMSLLAGRRRFERSSLPSDEQLRLHVDPALFLQAVQDV